MGVTKQYMSLAMSMPSGLPPNVLMILWLVEELTPQGILKTAKLTQNLFFLPKTNPRQREKFPENFSYIGHSLFSEAQTKI